MGLKPYGWHVDCLGPVIPHGGRWLGYQPCNADAEMVYHERRVVFNKVAIPCVLSFGLAVLCAMPPCWGRVWFFTSVAPMVLIAARISFCQYPIRTRQLSYWQWVILIMVGVTITYTFRSTWMVLHFIAACMIAHIMNFGQLSTSFVLIVTFVWVASFFSASYQFSGSRVEKHDFELYVPYISAIGVIAVLDVSMLVIGFMTKPSLLTVWQVHDQRESVHLDHVIPASAIGSSGHFTMSRITGDGIQGLTPGPPGSAADSDLENAEVRESLQFRANAGKAFARGKATMQPLTEEKQEAEEHENDDYDDDEGSRSVVTSEADQSDHDDDDDDDDDEDDDLVTHRINPDHTLDADAFERLIERARRSSRKAFYFRLQVDRSDETTLTLFDMGGASLTSTKVMAWYEETDGGEEQTTVNFLKHHAATLAKEYLSSYMQRKRLSLSAADVNIQPDPDGDDYMVTVCLYPDVFPAR